MAISTLVLDCDGVILESMDIKKQAFAELVRPYGQEAVDRMVMFHMRYGGVNRREKFSWFFEEVLGKTITAVELEQWSARFEDLALESVKNCALVPGVEDVLRQWSGKIPIYVASGAPQEELRHILKLRNLDAYFTGIYGAPPHKSAVLQAIITQAKADPAEVLMVGDASTDMLAAETCGTLFYGRGKEFRGGIWPWGTDLCELNAWITAYNNA